MIRCLDANVCIGAIAGDGAILDRLARLDVGQALISSIAYAEVRLGIERDPRGREAALALLHELTRAAPVLPFDQAAATQYARLAFPRHRFDRLIAAHALALGAVVATRNPAEFTDIPGLAVEDWTRP